MVLAVEGLHQAVNDIRSAPVDILVSLPEHIAQDVLQHLDPAHIARCLGVSKAWRQKALGALARFTVLPMPSAWRVRRYTPREADRMLKFFARYCSRLREAVVRFCPSQHALMAGRCKLTLA